jgi:creatinine amidohydrolase
VGGEKMNWQELTSSALGKMNRRTPVVLPTGAVEQHGPHLPLATDRMIVEHLCAGLNRELKNQVLILPMLAVGCSAHHLDFPGSLTLTHETFLRAAKEMLSSAATHGFTRFLILNGHGGNQGIGQVIMEQFGAEHPNCKIAFTSWWRVAGKELLGITETGAGGVGHACEFETSLMLLIAPQLVNRKAIVSGGNYRVPQPDWARGDMLHGSRASLYATMRAMTINGVFGDPRKSSAEKGRSISAAATKQLVKILKDLRRLK